MRVYSIDSQLADAYRGCGHALVAIVDGQVADLLYLRDLLPSFDPDDIRGSIDRLRLEPAMAHLQAIGTVMFGIVSSWEFVAVVKHPALGVDPVVRLRH